ncbi:hypothetical protein [Anaerospora hongkongensis]|uniref:hypothetical protein n=1 Tax=Anaerospora hongkongensis TaxID=244830 RepID=UPI00289C22FE|nr:hypothetical protein [Anaerospora hongkongensis]
MLTVTGASDDLLVITGDIREEFNHYGADEDDTGVYLAFSDGTVLKAMYDSDGIWRLNLVSKGSLYQAKLEGCVTDDTNDVVTFAEGIKWVVCGTEFAK